MAVKIPLVALAFALFLALPAFPATVAKSAEPSDPEEVRTRIVVAFDKYPAKPEAFAKKIGGELATAIPDLATLVVSVPDEDGAKARSKAARTNGVTSAIFDRSLGASATPNDLLVTEQWGLAAVGLLAAWDHTVGSHNRKIAILDTGVDRAHIDLAANVCHTGAGFLTGTNLGVAGASWDDNGHGTHAAGIAGAIAGNGKGIAGASQSCLMPVKVLNAAGAGFQSDVAAGIVYAANNGANVISLSLGSQVGEPVLANAVKYAWDRGALLVAAAGNDSGCKKGSTVDFPAAYPEVLAVTSVSWDGAASGFSSCGPEVDLIAPGSGILSTYVGNSYLILSGTSMSTPFVAGIAALAWSCNPQATNAEVRAVLEGTATDLRMPSSLQGHGLPNALASVRALGCA